MNAMNVKKATSVVEELRLSVIRGFTLPTAVLSVISVRMVPAILKVRKQDLIVCFLQKIVSQECAIIIEAVSWRKSQYINNCQLVSYNREQVPSIVGI